VEHVTPTAEDGDISGLVIERVAVDVVTLCGSIPASGALVSIIPSQRSRPSSPLTCLISQPGMVLLSESLAFLDMLCRLLIPRLGARLPQWNFLAALSGAAPLGTLLLLLPFQLFVHALILPHAVRDRSCHARLGSTESEAPSDRLQSEAVDVKFHVVCGDGKIEHQRLLGYNKVSVRSGVGASHTAPGRFSLR